MEILPFGLPISPWMGDVIAAVLIARYVLPNTTKQVDWLLTRSLGRKRRK
ncbi:MAG TPA: hypothetical protein VLS25_02755 [Dehalococcoidia bacterium]|nr:hypothetical protein [Dehalococcoidia bacterium]